MIGEFWPNQRATFILRQSAGILGPAFTGLALDGANFNHAVVYLQVVATVLGLVAEIERDFISARTKEALAKRKADGMKLGRPTGQARSLRLDAHADKIGEYLAKGIDKRSVAKLLNVAPNTLYAWLKGMRPANPS